MMWRYFELLTRVPESEIAALRSAHPMEAKKRLARTITAQYYGDRGAVDAEERFARVHQHRNVPDEIETAPRTIGFWRNPSSARGFSPIERLPIRSFAPAPFSQAFCKTSAFLSPDQDVIRPSENSHRSFRIDLPDHA